LCARTRMGDNARSELHVVIKDPAATLDNLRESVTTLEDTEQIAQRVFGGSHPFVVNMENALSNIRAHLHARDTPPPPPPPAPLYDEDELD